MVDVVVKSAAGGWFGLVGLARAVAPVVLLSSLAVLVQVSAVGVVVMTVRWGVCLARVAAGVWVLADVVEFVVAVVAVLQRLVAR